MITTSSPSENLEVICAASILLTLRADNRSPIRVPLLSSIDKETSKSMRKKRPCGKCKQRKRRCTHKSDFPKGEAKSGETAVIQDIYPHPNTETERDSRSEIRHEEKSLDPETFGKILQTSFVDTIPNFQYGQHGQQSNTESFPKDELCPKCESGTSCLRTDCAFVYASASKLFQRYVQDNCEERTTLIVRAPKISIRIMLFMLRSCGSIHVFPRNTCFG